MAHCNGPNPNETFGSRNRPEKEPIEFGEGTSSKKPVSTNEPMEKESRQGRDGRVGCGADSGVRGQYFPAKCVVSHSPCFGPESEYPEAACVPTVN